MTRRRVRTTVYGAGVLLALGVIGAGAALAQSPLNPGVTLVNHSSAAITQVLVKPAGSSKWGGNVLDGGRIDPQSTRPLHVAVETNCFYDLRIVYGDGHSEERPKVDLCKHQDVVLGSG